MSLWSRQIRGGGPGNSNRFRLQVCEDKHLLSFFFSFFSFVQILEDTSPFRVATDTPVLDFGWRLRCLSKPGWIPCMREFIIVGIFVRNARLFTQCPQRVPDPFFSLSSTPINTFLFNNFFLFTNSCSICNKKQNRHFIVPHSKFKLLQVSKLNN